LNIHPVVSPQDKPMVNRSLSAVIEKKPITKKKSALKPIGKSISIRAIYRENTFRIKNNVRDYYKFIFSQE